ncbi:MAG: thiamine phosphate synthase [Deltaproteobacteria bacterium]|nr:thiamine phosphate synthase [Deltaproteobacteria bacterium]
MKIFRVIDANLNRASEGLRVIEEINRFVYEDAQAAKNIKEIRHKIRDAAKRFDNLLFCERDSLADKGFEISQNQTAKGKTDIKNLALRNFKRVQEALRVIEENFKTEGYNNLAKEYEKYRFLSYQLEKSFFELNFKKKSLPKGIYCITGEKFSLGRDNITVVKEMIKAGVEIIQYREKEKDMEAKYNECIEIRKLTKQAGTLFIVNDNIDLAIVTEADGVHVGQEDMPVKQARKLIGNKIIGVSTHSPEQAQKAVEEGADYIGVGPIFKTYTKKDVVDPVGYEYLDYVVKNINIPFVAIGGIKTHNIEEVAKRGAICFAMITEVVGVDDICEKIAELQQAIKG